MTDLEKNKNDENYSRIDELEQRLRYCEGIASQYALMFKQLQDKLKVLEDRQGNIQQVYDYMTRVGSDIAIKTPHNTRRLNPMTKVLPKDDKKYLDVISKCKFKTGDEVFYANESSNIVTSHNIIGIDVIDKHPRYCLSNILGYVDESKIFLTEYSARWELDEWNRTSKNYDNY